MEKQRLDKMIASTGKWSRREAKDLIRQGRVLVNGAVARSAEEKTDPAAAVSVDGELLEYRRYTWIMLNKPAGYLSATEDGRGPTVLDLLPENLRRQGLFPVGRLDKDTEGLLLLTNDGCLARRLTHPSCEVEKTYHVWVRGPVKQAAERLAQIRDLEGEPIRPARVETLRQGKEAAKLAVTIHQGKNRQVRRMCAACGLEVERLRRVREHTLALGTLPPGKWRRLTAEEVRELRGGGRERTV